MGGGISELSIGFSEANKQTKKHKTFTYLVLGGLGRREHKEDNKTANPKSPRPEVTRYKYFHDAHPSVAEQIRAGQGAGQMTRPFKPK